MIGTSQTDRAGRKGDGGGPKERYNEQRRPPYGKGEGKEGTSRREGEREGKGKGRTRGPARGCFTCGGDHYAHECPCAAARGSNTMNPWERRERWPGDTGDQEKGPHIAICKHPGRRNKDEKDGENIEETEEGEAEQGSKKGTREDRPRKQEKEEGS